MKRLPRVSEPTAGQPASMPVDAVALCPIRPTPSTVARAPPPALLVPVHWPVASATAPGELEHGHLQAVTTAAVTWSVPGGDARRHSSSKNIDNVPNRQ